jgi:hypothetical protein
VNISRNAVGMISMTCAPQCGFPSATAGARWETISGTDGITLVVYHADPGFADAEKPALLGSSALTPTEDDLSSAGRHDPRARASGT